MGLLKVVSVLGLLPFILASPQVGSSVNGTVTTTAARTPSVGVLPTIPVPPSRAPGVSSALQPTAILRTITATRWTGTTTITSVLNCTRTVTVRSSSSRARATTASRPLPRPSVALSRRQSNSTSAVAVLPSASRSAPLIRPSQATRRASTIRSTIRTTVTPTGLARVTVSQCAKTVTQLYTVVATVTRVSTVTQRPNVATRISTVACSAGAPAGPPRRSSSSRRTTSRAPLPTSARTPLPITRISPSPVPLPSRLPVSRRQAGVPPFVADNSTITVRLTTTVVRLDRVINLDTTTVVGYACSPTAEDDVCGPFDAETFIRDRGASR
ncbi:hypothetical protein QBC39DRAFT_400297 [Podospora conica]|nr:hypothetical protein QBC39DRAFT_400297 [Schizothecium conicum]